MFNESPWGRGSLSSLLGKNIKLRRGEGNIIAVGKKKTLTRGIFPITLRLLGSILSEEKGKGTEILGKKIRIFFKMGV